ncbi:MAG TPA: hypothetical protein VIY96_03490, partial [Thermoanaerobaculia bacterium]
MTGLGRLVREYGSPRSPLARLGDIDPPRNPRAGRALGRAIGECVGPAVSVGGGPRRVHPRFVNLNLAPFPNVDVV